MLGLTIECIICRSFWLWQTILGIAECVLAAVEKHETTKQSVSQCCKSEPPRESIFCGMLLAEVYFGFCV